LKDLSKVDAVAKAGLGTSEYIVRNGIIYKPKEY